MKRFTAILLTGMMIFTLASCGKKAQDTPTEPATETQAAEKVEMPTETEAVTEVVTEATKETQQTEAQQEEQTAEQPDEEQNNSGDNNSSYQYVERASYENGESVSLNPSWQYADHSAINSGCAVMYKATAHSSRCQCRTRYKRRNFGEDTLSSGRLGKDHRWYNRRWRNKSSSSFRGYVL